jgi:hypothetical protein
MNNTRVCGLLAALCLLPLVGCKQDPGGPRTVPAKGIVTLDGTPVAGAAVVFIGDDGQYSASGMTDDEGNFSLNAFEYKEGAVPGSYKVVVTKTVEITETSGPKPTGEGAEHAGEGAQLGVKNDLPKKYERPTDALAFVIPEDGTTELNLALTSGN